MKLRINGFERDIEFNDNNVNVMYIENTSLFTHVIELINNKLNGFEDNEIVLLDNEDNEINFEKNAFFLLDYFNIDYNSKKILKNIYDRIAVNIENNQDEKVYQLSKELTNLLISEINELQFEFVMKDSIEIQDLLKLYNLKIDGSSYTDVLDRVELVINLLAEFKIANLLILPNIKSFLDDEKLVELYKYSLYNNIDLFIIERHQSNKLTYEHSILIDENFNEIQL